MWTSTTTKSSSKKKENNVHFPQIGNPLKSLDEGFRLASPLAKIWAEKKRGLPAQVAVYENTRRSGTEREQEESRPARKLTNIPSELIGKASVKLN